MKNLPQQRDKVDRLKSEFDHKQQLTLMGHDLVENRVQEFPEILMDNKNTVYQGYEEFSFLDNHERPNVRQQAAKT